MGNPNPKIKKVGPIVVDHEDGSQSEVTLTQYSEPSLEGYIDFELGGNEILRKQINEMLDNADRQLRQAGDVDSVAQLSKSLRKRIKHLCDNI